MWQAATLWLVWFATSQSSPVRARCVAAHRQVRPRTPSGAVGNDKCMWTSANSRAANHDGATSQKDEAPKERGYSYSYHNHVDLAREPLSLSIFLTLLQCLCVWKSRFDGVTQEAVARSR